MDEAADDVDAVLTGLGLSSTERRTYRFLVGATGATPTTVAQETGQSRGRIYETLRALAGRGLVREEPTQPVRYHAVPLSEVLAVALAANHRRIQALETLQGTYAAEPAAPPRRMRPDDVSVFAGRRAVATELRRLLSRARRRFVVVAGGRAGERFARDPAFVEALRGAMRRGVRVELHLPDVGEAARRTLEDAVGAALPSPPPEAAARVLWAASEEGALSAVPQPDDAEPDRGEDVAVAVRGGPFAEAQLREIRLRLGETRDAPKSPPLAPVADLDPARVGLRFLEALASSRTEVLGMGPQGWGRFLERGWEATVGVYAAAKGRGVVMRALAADTPQERAALARFGALWDMRVVPWVPAWLIVVDRRELFQAFTVGGQEAAPQLRQSSDAQEVAFYVDLFERLWERGRPLKEESAGRSRG